MDLLLSIVVVDKNNENRRANKESDRSSAIMRKLLSAPRAACCKLFVLSHLSREEFVHRSSALSIFLLYEFSRKQSNLWKKTCNGEKKLSVREKRKGSFNK